ncbi:Coenzyme F420 hydrogenase/dehydrogenase, beta subunit C-terminal domain [Anaerostipes sp. MSJ-23]|uniref:Coenzyme F420 hydrogenase/dehydrogenase, beta subunit C-terminal domain n=1 Tax=Anaerostipes sp. MSJ-23 TaxID=2841520 RepID=UPI001C12489D|nr:Coenzyme F420 hydrogenase/dehydrogenase, beta subunit C-terminal domain [Anaerostipes sp. MSJ-23]MBU5461085.1 Coenzyme F420 hydrogenase/dehydrogenase, beta subunit C-terminal domain [Anaerostipes sp. MSJ-23]
MIELIDTVVYAGRIKNESVLMQSSSGGAFTALSEFFLKNNNAVVASVYNYDINTAEFRLILNKNQREKAKGSKYMQSKPRKIFREAYEWLMENKGKKLLFVGMGCQADGFRKFCELKGIRDRVCIVDIICHGSPSPKLWKEYAENLQKKKKGKITYLTFKDKRNGWKSPMAYVKINGKEILIKDYVKIFYNRCALRLSCHECPYATTERKVDLTIGDYWHIEETMPDFYDSKGNSLFLIHTNKGQELFNRVRYMLDYKISNRQQCWQTNLEKPTPKSEKRDLFWDDYKKEGVNFIMKKYGTVSITTKVKNKLLKIIGGGTN